MKLLAAALLLVAAALAPHAAGACDARALRAGDVAWGRRADDAPAPGRARAEPIREAVGAYEGVLAADPDCLAAHAKGLEARFFAAEYASVDGEERRAHLDRAARLVDEAREALARRLGVGADSDAVFEPEALRDALGPDALGDAAQLHFWAAVDLAAWARVRGLVTAVRAGVAGRVRRHAEAASALAPEIESGGPHRVLSALHGELPRIPLITPWVDPARAVPEAERAYALAPDAPSNQVMLGRTLLERVPERRDEGISLLRRAAAIDPDPARRVEEQALRELARERLAEASVPLDSSPAPSAGGTPPIGR